MNANKKIDSSVSFPVGGGEPFSPPAGDGVTAGKSPAAGAGVTASKSPAAGDGVAAGDLPIMENDMTAGKSPAAGSDIIAALSTPAGRGGVALIRVSGAGCPALVSRLTDRDLTEQPPHTIRRTIFRAADGTQHNH